MSAEFRKKQNLETFIKIVFFTCFYMFSKAPDPPLTYPTSLQTHSTKLEK